MNMYTMMKISDRFDDDGIDECDINLDCKIDKDSNTNFKKQYVDEYNDIKIKPQEW